MKDRIMVANNQEGEVMENSTELQACEKQPGKIKTWVKNNWKGIALGFVSGIAAGFGLKVLGGSSKNYSETEEPVETTFEDDDVEE